MASVPRTYRLVVVALVVAALGVLAWAVLGAADRRAARETQRLREQLAVARADTRRWKDVAAARTAQFRNSEQLLNEFLATPQRAVTVVDTVWRNKTVVRIDSVPYVPQSSFDTLASRCQRALGDCSLALEAKDSLATVQEARLRAIDGLRVSAEGRLRRERAKGLLRTGRDVVIGAVTCYFLCPKP